MVRNSKASALSTIMTPRSIQCLLACLPLLAASVAAEPTDSPTPPAKSKPPAYLSGLPPLPSITGPSIQEIDSSIQRGIDFLISNQNSNGSWGGPILTKGLNIYAPLPGAHHAFRSGTSGVALYGILTSRDRRPQTLACIERAEAWFLKELPRLRRADLTTTYNVWGHAYGLRALSALHTHRAGNSTKQNAIKTLAQEQIDLLARYEDVNGGWGYLDFKTFTRKPSGLTTGFMTATVLIAMHEAREVMGLELPEKVVRRSLNSIRRQQTPDFAYVYSLSHQYRPRIYINRPGGSLCRAQVCSAALRYFGDDKITDDILKVWLERLIHRNGWIDIARKRPIPHETHFSNSGYFYYYGHFYATDCIGFLPQSAQPVYCQNLAKILLSKQEKDGSWWDYPLYSYHQPYGTGYALATLARCQEGLVAPTLP